MVLPPTESTERLSDSSSKEADVPPYHFGHGPARKTDRPLHRIFQESAVEGLSGVMSKVVQEVDSSMKRKGSRGKAKSSASHKPWERSRQKSPDPADIPLPSSPIGATKESPLLMRHSKEGATVQPLEYSPSVSVKREFPEYVLASGQEMKHPDKQFSRSRTASTESTRSRTSYQSHQETATKTKTMPTHKQTAAALSPEQSTEEFISEMNLLDSLAPLLSNMPYIVGNVSLEPEEETAEATSGHTSDLISPAHKKKLLDEASAQLKELRQQWPHSYPALDTSLAQSLDEKRCSTMPSLISPTRKQQLLKNASSLIQSKKSKCDSVEGNGTVAL